MTKNKCKKNYRKLSITLKNKKSYFIRLYFY